MFHSNTYVTLYTPTLLCTPGFTLYTSTWHSILLYFTLTAPWLYTPTLHFTTYITLYVFTWHSKPIYFTPIPTVHWTPLLYTVPTALHYGPVLHCTPIYLTPIPTVHWTPLLYTVPTTLHYGPVLHCTPIYLTPAPTVHWTPLLYTVPTTLHYGPVLHCTPIYLTPISTVHWTSLLYIVPTTLHCTPIYTYYTPVPTLYNTAVSVSEIPPHFVTKCVVGWVGTCNPKWLNRGDGGKVCYIYFFFTVAVMKDTEWRIVSDVTTAVRCSDSCLYFCPFRQSDSELNSYLRRLLLTQKSRKERLKMCVKLTGLL